MKKILFISVLFLFQCACSTQASKPEAPGNMLNFADLAAEISVEHEVIESTVALNNDRSGNSTD